MGLYTFCKRHNMGFLHTLARYLQSIILIDCSYDIQKIYDRAVCNNDRARLQS